VELALANHFGSRVKLILIVDDSSPGTARQGNQSGGPEPGSSDEGAALEIEEEDQSALLETGETATDQATEAEARLLEAFPGASEVVS
jgi:hypothetical protein